MDKQLEKNGQQKARGKMEQATKLSIPLALVITLCGMVATTTWAISNERNNYRLVNITNRLESHEDYILLSRDKNAEQDRVLERLTTELQYIREGLVEIKSGLRDIKELNGH